MRLLNPPNARAHTHAHTVTDLHNLVVLHCEVVARLFQVCHLPHKKPCEHHTQDHCRGQCAGTHLHKEASSERPSNVVVVPARPRARRVGRHPRTKAHPRAHSREEISAEMSGTLMRSRIRASCSRTLSADCARERERERESTATTVSAATRNDDSGPRAWSARCDTKLSQHQRESQPASR